MAKHTLGVSSLVVAKGGCRAGEAAFNGQAFGENKSNGVGQGPREGQHPDPMLNAGAYGRGNRVLLRGSSHLH